MARAGYKIVCIVEWDGAVYNAKGLDIPALMKHRHETGSITGFTGGEEMDKTDALFQETDVLIPAAKENVITSQNAHRLRTKILCEGANGPSTHFADPILSDKGIFIIPDILANAGGVTVSYFEWVQDRQGYFWSEQTGERSPGRDHGQQLPGRGRVRGQARREQSPGRVYAVARPRGAGDPPARDLRLTRI